MKNKGPQNRQFTSLFHFHFTKMCIGQNLLLPRIGVDKLWLEKKNAVTLRLLVTE